MIQSNAYEKLIGCFEAVKNRLPFAPQAAVVLGSGLGEFANEIAVKAEIDYHEIPGFPVSTVPGHAGKFVFGWIGQVPIVAMKGRVHYYEGYSMNDVVLPIRLMHLMGAQSLLLTNAAGGLQEGMRPGDFMLISDHISDFVPSPLLGSNLDALGVRFPDMSSVYDKEYRRLAQSCAQRLGISLKEGVYLQFSGPNYETPAEVRMAKLLGADAVGMSTVVEAMAANHMGMRICGISFISNIGCGLGGSTPLNHAEVQAMADLAAPNFKRLVKELIQTIGAEKGVN